MKRIGDTLTDLGWVTPDQLDDALKRVKERGGRLGEALIDMNLITESNLLEVLTRQLGIPNIPDDELLVDPTVIHEIPYALAKKYNLMPLHLDHGRLVVATSDPLNVSVIDDLENRIQKPISLVLASSRRIAAIIEQYYSGAESVQETLQQVQEVEGEKLLASIESDDASVQDTPVVKFTNLIIQKAVKEGASDIHIEVDTVDFHVRYRIDGILQTVFRPKKHLHPLIVSRLKVMSRLDVSEHRLPQDGRFLLKVDDDVVDFRVATVPCVFGENMVVRVLNRGPQFRRLAELGYAPTSLEKIEQLMARSHGLILVAGQTGSGKTTTLYTALRSLNDEKKKIITLEDPVEMHLPLLNQIQVNPKVDLTFATGLRSILRMDPDIILIGEIRDGETASLAINAAMTGHLVLSTIHTGVAAEVPVRLIEMGVEPYLVANTLTGAIAQRLVRLNCKHCLVEEDVPQRLFGRFNPEFKSYRGKGCNACNRVGYRGRTCIEEVLPIDATFRRLVLNNATTDEMQSTAEKNGMQPMVQAGLAKVKAGLTSFEELARVL